VDPKSGRTIVRWAIIISWVHIGFGLMDSVFKTVGGDKIIHLFRNASYAELDQTENGLVRIAGTFPESSAYASFAFIWFVFMVELWLREIEPRLAGLTAVALGVMLVACTSTTGYVALALYAVVLFVRWVVDPSSLRLGKILPLAMVALAGVTVALALFAFFPHLVSAVTRALHTLTVGKLNTASGQQRLYWVHTGITAFERTYGLGIGAGSFRSSGLLFAILGCTGVVGLVAFTAHCVKVLQPLKAATYRLPGDREALGVAMAWTTCAGLLPAFAAAPSPDPGVVFGVMSGLALGWRYLAREAPAAAMAGRRPRPIFGVAGAARAQ